MGAALFIVLEKQIPGFDATVNGKALSRVFEELDRIAGRLGIKPLMAFFSMSPDETGDLLADFGVAGEVNSSAEQWFAAEEGLRTIETLRTHLRRDEGLPDVSGVMADLDDFSRVLQKTQEAGVRWHLQVVF